MGLMGHGIAQISAAAGHAVVGVDLNAEVLAKGRAAIEASVAKMNSRKASKVEGFDAPAATEPWTKSSLPPGTPSLVEESRRRSASSETSG